MFGTLHEISIEKNYFDIFEAIFKKEEEALNMGNSGSGNSGGHNSYGNSGVNVRVAVPIATMKKMTDAVVLNNDSAAQITYPSIISHNVRSSSEEAKIALQRELEEITLVLDSTQETTHDHNHHRRSYHINQPKHRPYLDLEQDSIKNISRDISLLVGIDDTKSLRPLPFRSKSEAVISFHHHPNKSPMPFSAGIANTNITHKHNAMEDEIKADDDNSVKPLQPLLMGQYKEISNWFVSSSKHKHVHECLSNHMRRDDELLIDIKAFSDRLLDECCRNFELVHIDKGILEITTMQALHLPETMTNLLVRISYGKEVSSIIIAYIDGLVL